VWHWRDRRGGATLVAGPTTFIAIEGRPLVKGLDRRFDLGALVFGAIVLFAGGYYFLRNTLGVNLGELDWEPIWPILVIAIGISILYGVLFRSNRDEPRT
jgi:hypothetical protein